MLVTIIPLVPTVQTYVARHPPYAKHVTPTACKFTYGNLNEKVIAMITWAPMSLLIQKCGPATSASR